MKTNYNATLEMIFLLSFWCGFLFICVDIKYYKYTLYKTMLYHISYNFHPTFDSI